MDQVLRLGELLFGHRNALVWWQECNRAVLIFFYGLVLVRLAGRRVFGKWAALDIVVSIMVGSNLSRALTGGAPLLGTMAATTVMMAMHWILAHWASRSAWFSALVEGTPLQLGRDGALDRGQLRRGRISKNDIEEALRDKQVEHVGATSRVVLEPSGKITVLKAGT